MKFVIEERFVVALSDPGEDSGKMTEHHLEAATALDALTEFARGSNARLLGITERADNTVAATAWRNERLYRLRARPAVADDTLN